MVTITESIATKGNLLHNQIQQLPISGTIINSVQQWFDVFYPKYSSSISVTGQIQSYQYLFNQASYITNDKLILPTPVQQTSMSLQRIKQLFTPELIQSNLLLDT